jgi:hypothetical protein
MLVFCARDGREVKVKININDYVEFRLTQAGYEHLYHYYENEFKRLGMRPNSTCIMTREFREYGRMQLHEVMLVFGWRTISQNESMFVKNTLVYHTEGK